MYGVHVSSPRRSPDSGGTRASRPRRPAPRERLSRDRVLREAVAAADELGTDALTMRVLAERLGVVPMALYKHVADREDLLDGMVDVVLAEIEPPPSARGWRSRVRGRILASRQVLLRHPWVPRVIETRTSASAVVLAYMDALAGDFLSGGLSPDLAHHALHAVGSRMWGFTQEVFPTPQPPDDPAMLEAMVREFSARYPHILVIAGAGAHEPDSAVGSTCDDQFEFEFALDVILDGIERLHRRGWASPRGAG